MAARDNGLMRVLGPAGAIIVILGAVSAFMLFMFETKADSNLVRQRVSAVEKSQEKYTKKIEEMHDDVLFLMHGLGVERKK